MVDSNCAVPTRRSAAHGVTKFLAPREKETSIRGVISTEKLPNVHNNNRSARPHSFSLNEPV